jgi:hypothetical protein
MPTEADAPGPADIDDRFWPPTPLIERSMPETITYTPVNYRFFNRSNAAIYIHVLMEKTLVATHFLEKGKSFDHTAEHGQVIRLEYPLPPHKSTLKPTDSLREKTRIVVFENDGKYLKIKETFRYKAHVKIDRRKKGKNRGKDKRTDGNVES